MLGSNSLTLDQYIYTNELNRMFQATRFGDCYYANSTRIKITVSKPCRLKHTCEFGSYHKLISHVVNHFRRSQCNLLLSDKVTVQKSGIFLQNWLSAQTAMVERVILRYVLILGSFKRMYRGRLIRLCKFFFTLLS